MEKNKNTEKNRNVKNGADRDIVAETQVVVLMGGLGTRLGLKDRPKAMADVNGRPFFDYELKLLKRWRFRKFLFLVGRQAEMIENYYGDGSGWQVEIRYSCDGPEQLGTGGALKQAEALLEDDFLLLYGDSFMDMDYQELACRYRIQKAAGKDGVMAVLKNENRYDRSNVICWGGELVRYDKIHASTEMEYIDFGVSLLSKSILSDVKKGKKFDLSQLLAKLSAQGRLAAQEVTKRFYEIGTPGSWKEFSDYARWRFDEAHKAVFLDRDGVINELVWNDDAEQLDSPLKKEDFVYMDSVIPTLLSLQSRGYLLFIVTNQPAAAKGKIGADRLYDLNTWLIRDLESKGVSVEFVNVCPHHPQGGRAAQAPYLIRRCGCRKPEAGLILDLMEVYCIDARRSYMVGDSYTDIIAGKKAGLRTVLLGKLKCDMCQRLQMYRPDHIIRDIRGLEKILPQGEN